MTRDEMIAKLWWNGSQHLWDLNLPVAEKYPRPDWPATVMVISPPESYSDDELEKLCTFTDEMDADYRRIFGEHKRGMNLILIGKLNHLPRWFRARMSYTTGSFYSDTLDEAMHVFKRNVTDDR